MQKTFRLVHVVSFLGKAVVAAYVARIFGKEPWQKRRERHISANPLYGRIIRRTEMPTLRRHIRAAQALPVRSMTIACLVQGEEDVSEMESAMWQFSNDAEGNYIDVYVLTFQTWRWDALFFPMSLLAEGRNALLAAAAVAEIQRGWKYKYYIFLDADVIIKPSWDIALPRFEAFLRFWEPAVGLPVFGDPRGEGSEDIVADSMPEAVWHFDHIFVAVHVEAMPALLPYDESFDARGCWWVSQWIMSLLAGALYRNHVLLLRSIRVRNPGHSKYPKDACLQQFANASAHLRSLAPESVWSCLPDPLSAILRTPEGGVTFGSYLPWGEAHRKSADLINSSTRIISAGSESSSVDYGVASLQRISSCNNESTAVALAQPSPAPWCLGCESGEVILSLQVMTAARPRHAPNWNQMGLVMVFLADGTELVRQAQYQEMLLSAQICFYVARRLLHVQGMLSDSVLEKNIDLVAGLLSDRGMRVPTFDEVFVERGRMLRHHIPRILQLPVHQQLQDGNALSELNMENLISYLVPKR